MKNKTYEFPVTAMLVALGIIFVLGMVGMSFGEDSKTRCKYVAMEKQYSADDIIKLCGR